MTRAPGSRPSSAGARRRLPGMPGGRLLGCRAWLCYIVDVAISGFAALLERVRAVDPDLVLAADEVDSDLVDWFATLSPRHRLDRAAQMGEELQRLRDGRRPQ